jgi:hypothetical protein
MKRRLAILAATALALAALSAPAAAHDAGPCTASAEPGHSEFAQHHIVPNAQAQALGPVHGHAPGAHQGYGSCR